MNKLVIATGNQGKLNEIQDIFKELSFEILSLKDVGFTNFIDEDQDTFQKNARKKAIEVMKYTGEITLADDSGLEVDALGGRPGVHSARFAGINASDQENNKKLLRLMETVPFNQRQARFRCVIVMAFPNGRTLTAEGICEGMIGYHPRGDKGFGYDPLFIVKGYGKTFSELEQYEKNNISHRGLALRKIKEQLKAAIDLNNI